MSYFGLGGSSQEARGSQDSIRRKLHRKPSSNGKVETSQGKVSMVCVNDQTAFYSPVWINGVKFTKYLIDSRSVVNLIIVKDAVKHGFTYKMGGIKKIMGFNGSSSLVDGL